MAKRDLDEEGIENAVRTRLESEFRLSVPCGFFSVASCRKHFSVDLRKAERGSEMTRRTIATLVLACAGAVACLVTSASAQFRELSVNAAQVTGTVRSLQGVNQVPVLPQSNGVKLWPRPQPDLRRQYKELGIDSVRTHDTDGPTDIDAFKKGHPVDGTIFPNWDADPEKPKSYIFGPSDQVITATKDTGADVYFRIGRTYDSDPIRVPDYDKYASVVKHVAMHYNSGWAEGYHYNIHHWEFWNEPDVAADWIEHGSGVEERYTVNWPEPIGQFYKLYAKVAMSLKSYDPKLKVGCCALSRGQSSSPYREGFIRYCAENNVPLDFYSWHHYTDDSADPWDYVRIGRDVREILDTNGLYNAEDYCTEWEMCLTDATRGPHPQSIYSMAAAAWTASTMVYMQDSPISLAHFEAGPSLFNRDGTYRKRAYVFKATLAMLKTPQRLAVTGADTIGFAVLAGRSPDGKTVQVLISNYEIPDLGGGPPVALRPPNVAVLESRLGIKYANNQGYSLRLDNLPWGDHEFSVRRYRITEKENFDLAGETSGRGTTFTVSNPLPPPGIELIVLEQK